MADARNNSGTITADTQDVRISPNGRPVVAVELSGTWTANLDVKIKVDGTEQNAVIVTGAGAVVSLPLTANQIAFVDAVGAEQVIVRANGAVTGSAAVYLNATDGKLPSAAGGSAVSISDGSDAALGAKADSAASTDIGTFSLIALTKRGLQGITTLISQTVGLLTISDFDTKTGSLTETAPATDTASSGVNGRLQRVAQRVTALIALFPTALGTTTAANSLPVALSSDGTYATLQGGVTETAPATDTASSGANGRLQRVAQRLSSLIAFFGLTNNNAAPGANHIGVLTGLANATAPTWTEGNETVASFTLKGDQRVSAGGYTPAAPVCTFTRGANTTAYTIGDEVGTASTAPTAVTVGRFNGASGVIQGAQVVYSSFAATTPQLVLLLFSATVTLAGDNAQLNLSDSDAKLLIGIIPLTASQTGQYSAGAAVSAGNTIFTGAPTAPIHFTCAGGAQTVFACLITLNAFTPIANSETLDIMLQVEGN